MKIDTRQQYVDKGSTLPLSERSQRVHIFLLHLRLRKFLNNLCKCQQLYTSNVQVFIMESTFFKLRLSTIVSNGKGRSKPCFRNMQPPSSLKTIANYPGVYSQARFLQELIQHVILGQQANKMKG